MIAGVAGGLADVFGVEPVWIRVAFVAAAFVGGLGVVTYLALWWLVRRSDLPRSAGQRFAEHFPDAPEWLGVGLLMFGAVLLAGQLGLWTPSIGWAFLLIGLGVVLFRRSSERSSDAGGGPPAGVARAAPIDPGSPPPTPHRRRRERSYLGWLALGLSLAAVGVVLMLRSSGRIDLSTAQLLALPLTILGLSLLVGAFVGRARAVILLGVLLIPMVLVATMFPVPLTGSWGLHYVHLKRADQLRPAYRQAGGPLSIDLTRVATNEISAPIRAVVAVGDIQLTVTGDRPIVLRGRIGVGEIVFFGHSVGGIGVERTLRSSPDDGRPPLVLELETGIGHIQVMRFERARPAREKA